MNYTTLHAQHEEAGARLVEFAGWHMPVQYPDGILAEHLATRRHAGLFDVSHMGRFEISGPEAAPFLRRVLTNDVTALEVGDSQYTMLSKESGGAIDDAFLYRYSGDRYLLVVNAANREKDLEALREQLRAFPGARLSDISGKTSMLAIQGPASDDVLMSVIGPPLPIPKRNACLERTWDAEPLLISRTGYTGEPVCFEVIVPNRLAAALWNGCREAGAAPVGLGARDTLRLEAALPLYGHELGRAPDGDEIPIFACALARFAVALEDDRSGMIGYEALFRQAENGVAQRIRPLALTGRGIARAGAAVWHDGRRIGWVTSGTVAPYWLFDGGAPTDEWDKRALALALIDSAVGPESEVVVHERRREIEAVVVRRFLDNRSGLFARPVLTATS